MIPLAHDFGGETVLVFGGGPVGARRARTFDREAEVVVVSPDFPGGDFGDAQRVRAAPEPGDLPAWFDRTQPALVVAATDDPALNDAIETEARDRGRLVNRADESGSRDAGSVVVPATVRDGPVVVAVSTGGRSPALGRYLRERIETDLDGAGAMADLTAEIREELQAADVPPETRREAVRTVVRSGVVRKALESPTNNARHVAADLISDVTGDIS